jgi:hypothetical protein
MRELLAVLFCAALWPVLSAEEPAVPEAGKPLLGCWQSEQHEAYFLLFESARVRVLIEGQLRVYGVTYEPGKAVLKNSGQKVDLPHELKDGKLKVKGEPDEVFKKLDKPPEAMELKPWPMAEPKPLSLARVKALQADFAERHKEDQAVRTNPQRAGDMRKVDTDNTAYLKKLVGEIGWIDVDRFGAEASNTAFLIVQHSGDLPLMLAALPPIEKDVKAGKLDGQPYALLYDRLQLYQGKKQRFGTQIGQDKEGSPAVLPLEDRAKVEQFRKEIGLFPLTQYLATFRQMSGGKEVKFMADED